MTPSPAKSVLTEEEYLQSAFQDLDREFLHGELVERTMPDYAHGVTQGSLSYYFVRQRRERGLPLFSATEVRVRLESGRYVVPDVAVYSPTEPKQRVPEIKPLAVLEILSPDEAMAKIRGKLQEYVTWGVPHVWLVDPHAKSLYVCDGAGLRETTSLPLPEAGLTITAADIWPE